MGREQRVLTTYLIGTLQGRIWWPAVICHQGFTLNLTKEGERYSDGRPDFRRLVVGKVCMDSGDFQSADLTDDSVILVKLERRVGNTFIKKERYFPITMFPSIADMVVERSWGEDCE